MGHRLRSVLPAAAAVLLGLGLPLALTAAPAYAGRNATAPISVSCPNGQIMTAAEFTLTQVPKWQKITVQTETSSLTRDHVSWDGGTAWYNIALDAKLTGSPAVAYISDDAWSGTFQMTGATCRGASAPGISAQGSACTAPPQITVQVTNPNSVRITYQVSVGASKQLTVSAGRTEQVTFDGVTRGRTYQVVAQGEDGSRATTSVTVDACITASPPTSPTPGESLPDSASPSPSTSVSASTSASASPSTSTSASPKPSVSVSPSEDDPFFPVDDESKDKGIVPNLPLPNGDIDEVSLNNPILWGGVVLILIGLITFFILFLRRQRGHHEEDTDDDTVM